MRIMRIIIILGLLVVVTSVIHAQLDNNYWYFAIGAEGETIYAFQPEGDPQPIGTISNAQNLFANTLRITSDSGVMISNDPAFLYLITPNGITTINLTELTQDIDRLDMSVIAQSESHLVLNIASASFKQPTILLNINSNEGAILTGIIPSPRYEAPLRFSQDGKSLRYATFTNEDETEWSLLERDLESGEERIIYMGETSISFIVIQPNTYGDAWILNEYDPETRSTSYYQISLDGAVDLLAEVIQPDSQQYQFWGNSIVISDAACTEDCEVTIETPEGDIVMIVIPFWQISAIGLPLVVTEDYWLVWVGFVNDVYRIDRDGTITHLGDMIVQRQQPLGVEAIMNSGQLLTVFSEGAEPDIFRVWDYETLEIIYEAPAPAFLFTLGSEGGLILDLGPETPQSAILTSDNRVMELPEIEGGRWQIIAPDGGMIYGDIVEDSTSILALNTNTGSVEIILENAILLPMPNLPIIP